MSSIECPAANPVVQASRSRSAGVNDDAQAWYSEHCAQQPTSPRIQEARGPWICAVLYEGTPMVQAEQPVWVWVLRWNRRSVYRGCVGLRCSAS